MTKRSALTLILAFTATAILDSAIVSYSSSSGIQPAHWLSLSIFVILYLIFVIISVLLLNSTRRIIPEEVYRPVAPTWVRSFHHVIIATTILTAVDISLIISQMIAFEEYNIIFLRIQTYLSHISPIVFLTALVFFFVRWFVSSKNNYVVLLYTISFSLFCLNLLVSQAYFESYFSNAFSDTVRPGSFSAYVNNVLGGKFAGVLYTVFEMLSLCSFLVTWVATLLLLGQYRRKMGSTKFLVLLSIPLIYYILPNTRFFGDLLFSASTLSPVAFSVIYVLFFSATKQVAALLFSLSFLTASSLVNEDRIRRSLLLSSVGMAILFGSIELTPLQYRVFPPFGLVTEAFIPLGAYLLFIGIYASARQVSRDAALRKMFYKSAESQLTLLRTIGVLEMEKELEKKVKFIAANSPLSEYETNVPTQEENVQEILRDVLNELYGKQDKEKRNK